MSISRYIVVAVVRCSWACSPLPVRQFTDGAERRAQLEAEIDSLGLCLWCRANDRAPPGPDRSRRRPLGVPSAKRPSGQPGGGSATPCPRPRVERPASLLEQAAVRHLVSQRMLERIFEVRKEASLVHELGGLEMRESVAQLLLGHVADRRQKREGNIFADDERGLEQALLLGRETVLLISVGCMSNHASIESRMSLVLTARSTIAVCRVLMASWPPRPATSSDRH
jgi:hypothetical protein